MKVLKLVSVMAGLFTMVSTSVLAADLDPPPMRPSMDSGLYVRGDIGIGVHTGFNFANDVTTNAGGTFCGACGSQSIADTPYISAGIGMEIADHFRIEVAGEYRSSADVKAMDDVFSNTFNPGTNLIPSSMLGGNDQFQSNTEYNGHLRSAVAMVNGYFDIFNFQGFTPYVGAGVGVAYNMLDDLNGENIATVTDCGAATCAANGSNATAVQQTVEYSHAQNSAKFNMAYALMAGTSYDISEHGKLDIGYRYLNLGSVDSNSMVGCACGTAGYGNLKVNDLASHEMRVGVRWLLD